MNRQGNAVNIFLAIALSLGAVCNAQAQTSPDERAARDAVASFYSAFNAHDFDRAAEFTTDDWEHINPGGGWTRGRQQVLAELRQVHGSFLKGVTDTVQSMTVRLPGPGTAVVTVLSEMTPFVAPDGVRHPKDRQIRTFVVVKRGERWLVMQDQNTIVSR
jgi:uncharacterized protein (TIGR02246 family)